VIFADNATVLGSARLLGGVAQFTATTLAAGQAHSITATYSGDTSFQVSASGPLAQTVKRAATSVSLAASNGASQFGQATMFTACVSVTAPGAGILSGTVRFVDGSIPIGTASLNDGWAALTTTVLLPGRHAITAVYGGSSLFQGSSSPIVNASVAAAPSRIALLPAVNTTVAGQAFALTAVISSPMPGALLGDVTFLDGTATLGSAHLSGTVATLAVGGLDVGLHALSAVYTGAGGVAGLNSPALAFAVTPAATATTVTASTQFAQFGQWVTYTATVVPVVPATGVPAGAIAFYDGEVPIGVAPLFQGTARVTLETTGTGATHIITARYTGDSSYQPSASFPVPVTVVQATSQLSLYSVRTPAGLEMVSSVRPTTPGGTVPTGAIMFQIVGRGHRWIGRRALQNGTAREFLGASLGHGRTLRVAYSGDTNCAPTLATLQIDRQVEHAEIHTHFRRSRPAPFETARIAAVPR
jgi:hypothetical protein